MEICLVLVWNLFNFNQLSSLIFIGNRISIIPFVGGEEEIWKKFWIIFQIRVVVNLSENHSHFKMFLNLLFKIQPEGLEIPRRVSLNLRKLKLQLELKYLILVLISGNSKRPSQSLDVTFKIDNCVTY